MLFRGMDTFAMWCSPDECAEEVLLPHEVWAATQKYGDFRDFGTPSILMCPINQGQ